MSRHAARLARLAVAGLAVWTATPLVASAQDAPVRSQTVWKDVAPPAWNWLEDYLFAHAVYVIGCPHNRKCEAGTGVFFLNEPRGSRKTFSGDVEMSVYGAGALYVRVRDGDTSAKVGFYRKETTLVPIYPAPSLPKAFVLAVPPAN